MRARVRHAVALAAASVFVACGGERSPAPAPANDSGGANAHANGDANGGADAANDERDRARGVILLVVDTLRADRLSAYGYPRATPNLDAFARDGTLYLDNRPQGSWTRPSMQSMMSGLYVSEEYDLPAPEVPLLAEVLAEAGVETAAFVANPVLGRHAGFDRGFDHYELYPKGDARAGHVFRQFRAWLERREDAEREWFAWVHLMDPHHPYQPLAQDDAYKDVKIRPGQQVLRPRWKAGWDDMIALAPDHGGPETFAKGVGSFVRESNAYDGEVLTVGRIVADLVALLEARGELDDTLVVLASDHGEMLREYRDYPRTIQRVLSRQGTLPQGLFHMFAVGHTGWLYEPIWRTPLILRGPGFRAGERVSGLVGNIDIHPTILRALDVEPAIPLDGAPLQGSIVPDRDALFGYGRGTSAVIDADGWRLVSHSVARFGEGRPTRELLRAEPVLDEPTNLADANPGEVERLQALVDAWRADARFTGTVETSEASRAVLEQLGYAVPGDDDDEDDAPAGEGAGEEAGDQSAGGGGR